MTDLKKIQILKTDLNFSFEEREPRNTVSCVESVDYHYHSLKFVFSHHDGRTELMISTIIFYIFGGELSVESYILR